MLKRGERRNGREGGKEGGKVSKHGIPSLVITLLGTCVRVFVRWAWLRGASVLVKTIW